MTVAFQFLPGETKTGAITVALRESLERERRERGAEARFLGLWAIGQRCASLLDDDPVPVDHGDFLYDENGLPK